ncbi:hypothetical protein AURDEDRAFT_132021, partial [Auricularia subglabra TFB-10046 SS5]
MSPESASDNKLLKEANQAAKIARDELLEIKKKGRTAGNNAQLVWARLKEQIVRIAKRRKAELARARAQEEKKRVDAQDAAKLKLENTQDPMARTEAQKELEAAETALHALKESSHEATFKRRDAKHFAEAETMKKSWFQWTKENRPRDTFATLRKPNTNPPEYVHDSQSMANIAGEYHDSIQNKDLDVGEEERAAALDTALRHVNRKMPEECKTQATAQITREDILESLMAAKNGSAAGLDGLIYEFWKAWNRKFETSKDGKEEWMDIVGMMTEVYVDIETYGIEQDCGFADGW